MTHIHDSDTLITRTQDALYLDLACGYGQPCETTVYLKKPDGSNSPLTTFRNNTSSLMLGSIANLRAATLDIHTTIHDTRDNPQEAEDISLKVKVYEQEGSAAETSFTRKTKGKGSIFHSFYMVMVI